jgi:hypothetical protein
LPKKSTTSIAEIVLEVPQAAEYVRIGVVVVGKGKAWFDDLKVEVVGNDVAPTNVCAPAEYESRRPKQEAAPGPTNLGFEGVLQNR